MSGTKPHQRQETIAGNYMHLPALISLEAAAKRLGTNVKEIRKLRDAGKLTPYRFHGQGLMVVALAEVLALKKERAH